MCPAFRGWMDWCLALRGLGFGYEPGLAGLGALGLAAMYLFDALQYALKSLFFWGNLGDGNHEFGSVR